MSTITPPRSSSSITERGATRIMVLVLIGVTALRLLLNVIAPTPLDLDEVQYWTWSRTLALGYFTKPPLIAWVIAGTTSVFGDTPFGIRFASPICYGIAAWMTFLTGRRLFGPRVGLWSGALFLTLPFVSFYSTVMLTDALLLVGWSVALYAFVRALEDDRLRWWVLCGVAVGVGFLAKYTAAAFIPSAVLYLLVSRQDRRLLRAKGPYVTLLAALVTASPNLVWNATNGLVTVSHLGGAANWTSRIFRPEGFLPFVASQWAVFGLILFPVLVYLCLRIRRFGSDRRMPMLLLFVIPLLGLFLLQALVFRAYPNWALPVYVSATIAVAAWLIETGRVRWLLITLLMHGVIGVGTLGFEGARKVTRIGNTRGTDIYARRRGWSRLGEEVAALRVRYPDAAIMSNRRYDLAFMMFFGGVPPSEAYQWQYRAWPETQYHLDQDLKALVGRDAIFVTRRPNMVVPARRRFASAEELTPIVVSTHEDHDQVFHVTLLRDFLGIEDAER